MILNREGRLKLAPFTMSHAKWDAVEALPPLPKNAPFGGHILSHDFVEAALMRKAGYAVRLATTHADLIAVQSLRFQVFNLELRQGLATSYAEGLDADRYDKVCDHLLVQREDNSMLSITAEGVDYLEAQYKANGLRRRIEERTGQSPD